MYSVYSVEFEEARTRYTEGVGEVTDGGVLFREGNHVDWHCRCEDLSTALQQKTR
jgi:hypothetical protein